MPFYYKIKEKTPEGKRTAQRLLDLRARLSHDVPPRDLNEHLLLATWNLREFDSTKYGKRTPESYQYIAEIVSHFDLVAVQEVRDDLKALEKLQDVLGAWWKYVVTDVTEGTAGNRERMAFLYDSRKVRYGGLAGEVVLPPERSGRNTYTPRNQLARTPFICGFSASWFKFMLCTVHILYGKDKANDPRRVREITLLSEFLAKRAKHKAAWAPNLILLGDFNIYDPKDLTMQAILDNGFEVPPALQEVPGSNVKGNRHYDQIAFMTMRNQLLSTGRAGVLNFFDTVYKDDDEEEYRPAMGEKYEKKKTGVKRTQKEKTRHYKQWRTFQMSDHYPMWVELKTDFGEEYLRAKAR
jgi:endonuclease/exonuclease/phosphatase family metal-dependent hydrolase